METLTAIESIVASNDFAMIKKSVNFFKNHTLFNYLNVAERQENVEVFDYLCKNYVTKIHNDSEQRELLEHVMDRAVKTGKLKIIKCLYQNNLILQKIDRFANQTYDFCVLSAIFQKQRKILEYLHEKQKRCIFLHDSLLFISFAITNYSDKEVLGYILDCGYYVNLHNWNIQRCILIGIHDFKFTKKYIIKRNIVNDVFSTNVYDNKLMPKSIEKLLKRKNTITRSYIP